MKNVTMIRVRHAAAVAGVGSLLALTACSESPAEDETSAGSQEATQDESGAEGSDGDEGAVAEDSTAQEESADDEGEAGAAAGVVAPAEDFDPCSVVTADQVSGVVDFAVSEGTADDLMGSLTCTFAPSDGQAASVLLQWVPVASDLDEMIVAATGAYDNTSDPEDVTVAGTSRAVALTGETMGMTAAVVIAEVEGGFFQVVVLGEGSEADQAVALTELTVEHA
ncbi:hypothetical protein [Ruania halotolerans]|uniref:hypothetical protein n=1 Tax=Ruania halotolerans TaxID=2897773 RepID=UPI001E356CB3|nr:hypothetical protein [Ruania halotolerans]UFU06927.1 hypothetical protein LQF10_02085 [Ruania halotolerans]